MSGSKINVNTDALEKVSRSVNGFSPKVAEVLNNANNDISSKLEKMKGISKVIAEKLEEARQQLEEARQQLEEAKQNLEAAEQNLEMAEQNLEAATQRYEACSKDTDEDGSASSAATEAYQEMNMAEQEVDSARQEVDSAKQEVEKAEKEFKQTAIIKGKWEVNNRTANIIVNRANAKAEEWSDLARTTKDRIDSWTDKTNEKIREVESSINDASDLSMGL